MHVTLLCKRYELVFQKMPAGQHGECDSPDSKSKQIRISNTLKDEQLIEILLHEMLHGLNWRDSEEHIDESGRDLARVLWRLGYRRVQS